MRPCARLGDGSREAILDGTFKPRFWARQLLPSILLLNYPQLKDERAKRTHRKAYRGPSRSCGISALRRPAHHAARARGDRVGDG